MKNALAFFILMLTKGHGKNPEGFRHKVAGWVFRRFPGQITCADFEGFLLDYHDGTLPEPQRQLFETHMKMCSQCRASLRGYVRTIELGQQLFARREAPLPDEVPDHIVAAVVSAMKAR